MAYLDFGITSDGKIESTSDGQFLLKDRSVDIAANVIISNHGDYKYAPTVGGRARLFLNSLKGSVVARSFRVAMLKAGFSRPVVDVSNFPSEIKVNTDETLGQ